MSLYNKYEALSPIYQGGLTNHLPMLLQILKKWHVDESLIEEMLDQYVGDLGIYDLTNSVLPITDFDKDYIHLTNYYTKQINEQGIKEVVSSFLTEMKLSFSSALFHGVIRLYYSIDSDDSLQVAQGLAFFNLVSEGYSLTGNEVSKDSFKERIILLKEEYDKRGIILENKNSMEMFYELLQHESIRDRLVYIEPTEFEKEEILDIILQMYIETESIYVAHLITGFHAIMRLNTYNLEYQETMKQFMLTMQVLYLLASKKRETFTKETYSIDELFDKKKVLNDPHDIKLFQAVYDLSLDMNNEKIHTIMNMIIQRNE